MSLVIVTVATVEQEPFLSYLQCNSRSPSGHNPIRNAIKITKSRLMSSDDLFHWVPISSFSATAALIRCYCTLPIVLVVLECRLGLHVLRVRVAQSWIFSTFSGVWVSWDRRKPIYNFEILNIEILTILDNLSLNLATSRSWLRSNIITTLSSARFREISRFINWAINFMYFDESISEDAYILLSIRRLNSVILRKESSR